MSLVRWGARAAFGRHYGFEDISGIRAYRESVPTQDAASLAPWLSRVLEGEPDVMWRGVPRCFVSTVSSEGRSVFLPQSHLDRCGQRRRARRVASAIARALGERRSTGVWVNLYPEATVVPGQLRFHAGHSGAWVRNPHGPTITWPPGSELLSLTARLSLLARTLVHLNVDVVIAPGAWIRPLLEALRAAARPTMKLSAMGERPWPWRIVAGEAYELDRHMLMIRPFVPEACAVMDWYEHPASGIYAYRPSPQHQGFTLLDDQGIAYELAAPTGGMRLHVGAALPGVRYRLVVTTASGLFSFDTGARVCFLDHKPLQLSAPATAPPRWATPPAMWH